MSIEVMRKALEALEHEANRGNDNAYQCERDALRAAIEQAAEPVAWRWKEVKGEFVGSWVLTVIEPPPYVTESMPLYTAPRQWVGLTDEEYTELWGKKPDLLTFFRKIEAKLKEKNA